MNISVKFSFFWFNVVFALISTVFLSIYPSFVRFNGLIVGLIIIGYFISTLAVHYIFWYISFTKVKIFKTILFIFNVLGFIIFYITNKYNVVFNLILLDNLINDLDKSSDVIFLLDVLIMLVFTLFYGFILKVISINKDIILPKKYLVFTIWLVCYLFTAYTFKTILNPQKAHKHFSLLTLMNKNIIKYYSYFNLFRLAGDYSIDKYFFYTAKSNLLSKLDLDYISNNINIVFIMFASVRVDRLSVFGYNLNTTPNLNHYYTNKKIAIFTNKACQTYTLVATNCMLSLLTEEKFRKLKKSQYPQNTIIKDIANNNFTTNLFYNNTISNFSFQFQHVYSNDYFKKNNSSVFDETVILQGIKLFSSNNNSTFNVFILDGAHFSYNTLLKKEFKIFKNDYDNKILQLDNNIKNAIELLEKTPKPTIVFFVSDHGESLGEVYNGKQMFFHGADYKTAPKEQLWVPVIIYANLSYKKLYPHKFNSLLQSSGKIINSDYISNTILGCSGFKGNSINQNLNLCKPN